MENDEFDTRELDNILKALNADTKFARVGILGNKNARTDSNTNAEIGAKHEFGDPEHGLPVRSFLRMPITTKLQSYLENSGAFTKESMKEVVQTKSLTPWLSKVAIIAEAVISDAFQTSGFGQWPKWKSKNYMNNTGMILIDTQQLRNSITSQVDE